MEGTPTERDTSAPAQKFEVYDTCVLKSDPSLIGTVERTYHDFNTHSPVDDCLIISHASVPTSKLEEFVKSGVPPKGYIFLKFADEECGLSLLAEKDVILLDRSMTIGDAVKRNANDAMIGTVTSVSDSYILQPISRMVKTANGPVQKFYDADGGRDECVSSCYPKLPSDICHYRPHGLLYNIPGEELRRAADFIEGDYVIDQDWLGVVQECDLDVVLLLENQTVVMVQNSWELELIVPDFKKPLVTFPECDDIKRPDILAAHHEGLMSIPPVHLGRGQFVITNQKNIRCGRWLFGEYDSRCKPQGHVLDVRTKRAEVQWLCPNAFAPTGKGERPPPQSVKPYENLASFRIPRDLRRNKGLTLYDRGKGPVRGSENKSATSICSGQDFGVGDRVRFRDQIGASLKYQATDHITHGRFERISRDDTFGFDLNEFKVICGRQEVSVLWQDQTVTKERTTALRPYFLPEAELCPGDIVSMKEDTKQIAVGQSDSTAAEFNEMIYFQGNYKLRPKKIGVIQAVNAKQRLAHIRWFLESSVELLEQGHVLKAGSRLGRISETIDEVSLYEIMTHPALMRRRRDLVIIPPKSPSPAVLRSISHARSSFNDDTGTSVLSHLRNLPHTSTFDYLRTIAKPLVDLASPRLSPVDQPDNEDNRPIDWVGEIVDLGIDGLVTVRLGALSACRESKLAYERVLMVVDEEAEMASIQSEVDLLEESASWDDHHLPGEWEEEYDSPVDEIVEYEGGERLDDDSGDEMWMTVDGSPTTSRPSTSGDGDIEMKDSSDQKEKQSPISLSEGLSSRRQASESSSCSSGRRDAKPLTKDNQPASVLMMDDIISSQNLPSSFSTLFSHNRSDKTPPSCLVLDTVPPSDQFRLSDAPHSALAPAFLRRINREHRMLSSSLPEGEIFVRTYESRLDLMRCLIVGPINTPYEHAPFVIDLYLGPSYPNEPPLAYFHSWTGGLGRVNPNLYEEGKICLSLLGTWPGKAPGEIWNDKANILQILVSIMGLVLVKQPFYNEAGFESFEAEKVYSIESQQYSEKAFVMARVFVKHALLNPVKGLEDVLAWLYLTPISSAGEDSKRDLMRKVVSRGKHLIAGSARSPEGALMDGAGETSDSAQVFLLPLSQGAVVMLRRNIQALEGLLQEVSRAERSN